MPAHFGSSCKMMVVSPGRAVRADGEGSDRAADVPWIHMGPGVSCHAGWGRQIVCLDTKAARRSRNGVDELIHRCVGLGPSRSVVLALSRYGVTNWESWYKSS